METLLEFYFIRTASLYLCVRHYAAHINYGV